MISDTTPDRFESSFFLSTMHVEQPSASHIPKILSLDGGGVRGLSSLLILREIMNGIEQEQDIDEGLKPCHYFDLIGGTSTGGLIAIMLGALGMTVDECIDAYLNLSKEVFAIDQVITGQIPVGDDLCRFDYNILEDCIKSIIQKHLGDENCKMNEIPNTRDNCPTFVVAKTKANIDGPPHVFRTYKAANVRANKCALWQAARATTAAPTFFKPMCIELPRPSISYVDGGIGHNNPSEIALNEAKRIWPASPRFGLISIGTGQAQANDIQVFNSVEPGQKVRNSVFEKIKSHLPAKIAASWDTTKNFTPGIKAIIEMASVLTKLATNSEDVHRRIRGMSRSSGDGERGQFQYFRFNVPRDIGDIGLGDWERSEEMAAHTLNYVREPETEDERFECIKFLLSGPRPRFHISNLSNPSMQKLDESISSEQDRVDNDPLNYWSWRDLTAQYAKINDLEGAIKACERGIEKWMDNPAPLMELTNLYAANGDYQAAITTGMQLDQIKTAILIMALNEPGSGIQTTEKQKLKENLKPILTGLKSKPTLLRSWLSANPVFTSDTVGRQYDVLFAAWSGNQEIMEMAIRHHKDIAIQDDLGWTAIHLAVWNTHNDICELLLDVGTQRQWASAQSLEDGYTALHLAASNNDIEGMKSLLEAGATVSVVDNRGFTPIHWAARNGHLEAITMLQETGAEVSATAASGETPMHLAAESGHLEAMKLLKELGADISVTDQSKQTPVHWAVRFGHVEAIKVLKEMGADVSAQDNFKETPVHLAAKFGHIEVIKALKKLGVNPLETGYAWKSAMHFAAEFGQVEVIKILKEMGGNVAERESSLKTPMHEAAKFGHVGVIKILKEMGSDIEARDTVRRTPMHYAAKYEQVKVIRLLNEMKADLSPRDSKFQTPMHYAAMKGNIETIRVLIELGADISLRDAKRRVPMHYAAENGLIETIKVLKELGADITSKTIMRYTPKELAIAAKKFKAAELLGEMESA